MNLTESFGSKVFGKKEMQKRLPPAVYESLTRTTAKGQKLDMEIATIVAQAMKEWAMENGATHYTHWFQPMTGITAGKLDAFLSPDGEGGAVTEFSPKALVMGEPDASSFPNGGLRATFEARGYTAWDPTSPAFIREDTLYIPTAFCSYTGEALDTKTPLLRSMGAVNTHGLRLLHALGYKDVQRVIPTVGAEQEYFLIDRSLYENRMDLKVCGRTLMGARPPKGQELDDHYCGRIKIRVAEFMRNLDHQLWELGVSAKTKHNEAAPAQHELAPVYATVNIAADHNQLTMEVMRITAKKLGLACLLHEKPFDGVNGSGKHNNYGLCTDTGINLLNPGENPGQNKLFVLTLCAFLQGVDRHADLLRMSASSAGNDHRLGGYEAPPTIISVFLGESLTSTLHSFACGEGCSSGSCSYIATGVETLPQLSRDDCDRNRTSPFAFTGNKFEFRMVGSSQSIAIPNVILNSMIAEAFDEFATRLETASDTESEIRNIVADTLKEHSRIIFNGNNYSQSWTEEAERRGLPILRSTVEAAGAMIAPTSIRLFEKYGIFSSLECHSRYEIMLENFSKVIHIEASTMLQMARRQVLPAVLTYISRLAQGSQALYATLTSCPALTEQVSELSRISGEINLSIKELETELSKSDAIEDEVERAEVIAGRVRAAMNRLMLACDAAEAVTDAQLWPMPTVAELLHKI